MASKFSTSEELEQLKANQPEVNYQLAANPESGFSTLLDAVIVIAERKALVFAITLSFTLIAVMFSLLAPARYTATVTLLPPQQQNSSLTGLAAMSSQLPGLNGIAGLAGGALGLKNPNDMYVAMLKSRTVESAMVERFGLMREYHVHFVSDACNRLEHNAKIDGSSKDGLLHLSIDDPSPKRAAEIANGYVEEFRKLTEHLAISEASQRRLFFEQQLERAKDNLAGAEEALKRTQQQTGLIQLDSQARALIETAAAVRAQITAKEVQIQALQTFATDQNAQLVQAKQELESLRTQLAKLGGNQDNEDSILVPKGKVPEAGLEYLRKFRDVKYYETIFEILARQFEAAKIDEAREGALIQVIDPAVPPDRRSFPRRGILVSVTTGVGFFVAIFAVLVFANFKGAAQDAEAAAKLAHLRDCLSPRWRPTRS